MARGRLTGRAMALAVAVASTIGCGPDARTRAEQQLVSDGFGEIVLTERGEGVFEFQATRDGLPCRGSVSVSGGFGSQTSFVGQVCGWPTEGEPMVAACEASLATAPCEDAEVALFEGTHGLARDPARAIALAVRACGAGRAQSCSNAGIGFRDGRGAPADPARALALFTRACEGGFVRACHDAGSALEEGTGAPADPARAGVLFRRGCDAGDAQSCEDLGVNLAAARDPARDVQARAAFERGCAGAFPAACRNLAVFLHTGRGGAADEPRALQLWQTGCDEHDDARACGALAEQARAAGGEGSRARALTLLERACELGRGVSCAIAGEMYVEAGPARDLERARHFMDLACQREDALGCRNFAVMMRDGMGGPRDREHVRETLERACRLGDEPACADVRAHAR